MTSKIHRHQTRRFRCRIDVAGVRLMTSALAALGIAGALEAHAQLAPPDDFFNGGAQFYISNNIPAALERVETGLRAYPDDQKLKRLEELLKQQQQQQQQNQQQQNQQNQQQQNNDSSNNSQDQSKQSSDQNKQERPQPKPKENGKDQEMPDPNQAQQKPAENKDAEKSDEKPPENLPSQPMRAGEMKPEEAKRLLDSQKDGERLLQLKPQEKPRNSSRPIKDW